MAEVATKRRFFNVDGNPGKQKYYETIIALAQGEDVSDAMCEFVLNGTEFIVEGETLRAKTKTGDAKNAMDSDYAKALYEVLKPLVPTTGSGVSATELFEALQKKGAKSPKDTDWAQVWIARVLNGYPDEFTKVVKIVDKVDNEGLKKQVKTPAYIKVK